MAEPSGDEDSAGRDVLALGARGYSCQVFDEPETAWRLHQETHLIPWRGESASDLRVDRFDARNLLEDRGVFRQLKERKRKESGIGRTEATKADGEDAEETEQQLLHRLRFGDYAVEFPPSEEAFAAENKFPYQYPEDASDEESDGDAFEPLWDVPGHIALVRRSSCTLKTVMVTSECGVLAAQDQEAARHCGSHCEQGAGPSAAGGYAEGMRQFVVLVTCASLKLT